LVAKGLCVKSNVIQKALFLRMFERQFFSAFFHTVVHPHRVGLAERVE